MRETTALFFSSFFTFARNQLEFRHRTTKRPLGDKSSKMWKFIDCVLRHSHVKWHCLWQAVQHLHRGFLMLTLKKQEIARVWLCSFPSHIYVYYTSYFACSSAVYLYFNTTINMQSSGGVSRYIHTSVC